jgi:ATP-binding cassette subfamily B (MDR/TAP) protein 1
MIRINENEKDGDIIGKIEFKDVWFRYPTRKEDFVLRGMTLTIEPNETIALTGESGCGKSTFINLMMRFYDPDFGQILLDGRDLKDYNMHDLRRRVSLVMQEPLIFNYTIGENILYSKLDCHNDEIVEVAEDANALDFIRDQKDREEHDDKPDVMLERLEHEDKNKYIQEFG